MFWSKKLFAQPPNTHPEFCFEKKTFPRKCKLVRKTLPTKMWAIFKNLLFAVSGLASFLKVDENEKLLVSDIIWTRKFFSITQ